ncbi:bifunctional DNA primase/polymerase [Streptomyces sp. BI20]|uniref:bifunctional DNA primase/polymerase n=1 Tax=Streptomyces sp. BI20 TaxID=3403460 RepID=UPI003C752004
MTTSTTLPGRPAAADPRPTRATASAAGSGAGRFALAGAPSGHVTEVTAQGAAWLASATAYPRSTLALWRGRPTAPAVLPCGVVFDVVNVPTMFGRRVLDLLWTEGPGSGPVAVHRGRTLLFATPGTGRRLPSLLGWEEWGDSVPAPLCHGRGDAVTVPALVGSAGSPSRWLVAPDTRAPWLPGPEALLWACVRAARRSREAAADSAVGAYRP